MDNCIIPIEQVFEYVKQHIQYEWYYNSKRSPKQVVEDGKANCVDMAYFMWVYLGCKQKLPCRFVHARVQTTNRQDDHIFMQVKCNDNWITLDPTNKKHGINETYPIVKKKAIFSDLKVFGKSRKCENANS